MRTKKSLGQHFLKSERALKTIVDTADIKFGENILEIGPGLGALTEKLLASDCQLIAVEKDDELYEFLKTKFKSEINSGKLTLVHDDILNLQPTTYNLQHGNYKLVANIPYYITGAILEKFLTHRAQPSKMVLLVQKEVAKRIVDDKESLLSISVKAYGTPHYIEVVRAGSFVPAPRVDSAIIVIENISKKFFEKIDEKEFFKIVRAGFSSKRKKLSSNLSKLYDKEGVLAIFKTLNLDENLRAENVSVEIWQKISDILATI